MISQIYHNSRGSAAPLAMLFTIVSMVFTVAYLKSSFNYSVLEEYRYAEHRALYAAEAGLNEVGVVILPQLVTEDTLLYPQGKDYGDNENGMPIGRYKNIYCHTELEENSTRKIYYVYSTGEAIPRTSLGDKVDPIERTVFMTMQAQGFEDFMYFTDEEKPIGPGNTGVVNFGSNDQLEGRVHTNGDIVFSSYGCPEFSGSVTITNESVNDGGGIGSWGACDEGVFEQNVGGETVNILDTIATITFPPENSAQLVRANADYIFSADDMLFRSGKKDTMVMTEINFTEGGFWATQWWYNIPPIGGPPNEFELAWDAVNQAIEVSVGGVHFGANNEFIPGTGYEGNFLVLSTTDISGTNIETAITNTVSVGDILRISNADGSKIVTFSVTVDPFQLSPDEVIIQVDATSINYTSSTDEGFAQGEQVTLTNTSASTGLAEDVEWNNFHYYHDHNDNDTEYCPVGGRHHFDFDYWNAGGLNGANCDIFSCPDQIYNSDYVYMQKIFYPYTSPTVIYVKGGQVLVRGQVGGQYTLVTDDYTEYRRHDNMSIVDRVWGNIWLIDDIVYADSYSNGAVVHPDDGGTGNVLGLIAGGSVIIANTRPNGARGTLYGSDIKINGAIMAMYGGFISHYWQNTLTAYHDWNDNLTYGYIADGRGGHRNYYRPQESNGLYTNANDKRGVVHLWGSIVQQKRGYLLRNYPGPYNVSPGVGYDKNYHYDWNLRFNPPPYYPDQVDVNNNVILKMASYGELDNDL
tara:strand:- start:1200 stop:3446 length:2247 start_codon:yes stop_codon:yes gene_type:complete